MKLSVGALAQCGFILRAASWIVPRRVRADWLREWQAELACAWQISRENSSEVDFGLRRRCFGAFVDAAWYRLNREDLQRTREEWPRTPGFMLFALASVLLLLITASGYLPRMRSILLPPPYADAHRVATVSRAGMINSSEWVVPYSWVQIWRRPNSAMEAVAAYSAQPQRSLLTVAGRARSVESVQVEPGMSQLFGVQPLLGRVLPPEGTTCHPCLLLTYQAWQRRFGGNPNVVGKDVTIDGQDGVILGVLPDRFWFPSNDVDILRLDASFPGNKPVGVVARMRAGVTESRAAFELQRMITYGAGESFSGSSIQVWPLQERIRQPLLSYALALGVSLLVMITALWSGRLNLLPQRRGAAAAFRWWSFFAAKTSLLLMMLLAVVVEFTPEPYIFPRGRATLILESGSLWIFSVCCIFALWWSLLDQQGRCRACLHKLTLPAQIGPSGCMLLSWAGTELVCSHGHGLLHITETDVCWLEPAQWTQLDESWKPLFADSTL